MLPPCERGQRLREKAGLAETYDPPIPHGIKPLAWATTRHKLWRVIPPFDVFRQEKPNDDTAVLWIGTADTIRDVLATIERDGNYKGQYLVVSLKSGNRVRIKADDIGNETGFRS
jgi:hypothetical protein